MVSLGTAAEVALAVLDGAVVVVEGAVEAAADDGAPKARK